jgi:hypothetical protein
LVERIAIITNFIGDEPSIESFSVFETTQEKIQKLKTLEIEKKLEDIGCINDPILGIVFPNVDLSIYYSKRDVFAAEQPEPSLRMSKLTTDGILIIHFSEDMIAPSVIDQQVYRDILSISVASGTNDQVFYPTNSSNR